MEKRCKFEVAFASGGAVRMLSFCALVLAVSCARAERRISVADYRDKMAGAWIGQSVGVAYGEPTEFKRQGELFADGEMPVWTNAFINRTFAQDDIYVEISFIETLVRRGIDVTTREAGIDFANSRYRLWCANWVARNNLRKGIAAPASGHPKYHHTTDDLDFQIEADFAGILSPGLPGEALRLGDTFGSIMNYGDGLWAGHFIAAMYAEAYFSTDRVAIVETALSYVPERSRFAAMVRDMLAWHREAPADWKGAWRKAVDKYGRNDSPTLGKITHLGLEVKINAAMILLGYLFGEGDPDKTMYISTCGGYDSDCNPSSACGVLFTSMGLKAVPRRFYDCLDRTRKWEYTDYTYPQLLDACEKLARAVVLRAGGRIEMDAAGAEWFVLPDSRPCPRPFLPSDAPGPEPADARLTDAERARILYLPEKEMGEQSVFRPDAPRNENREKNEKES